RPFHGYNRLLTSQIIAHYDSINQCKTELPEYFNFASDVLDEWSQLEKGLITQHNLVLLCCCSFVNWTHCIFKLLNIHDGTSQDEQGQDEVFWRKAELFQFLVAFFPGIVLIPGTSQLTAKDILYRLQASKAKCIITSDTLAPAVESVVPDCQFLRSKVIVGKGSRAGWLNLKELL
ncbi:ACSM3 synthetase, partial [Sakesphorus luctuosus]|nr:ACSM3 synthetase [Sakesphorus luctuosus]